MNHTIIHFVKLLPYNAKVSSFSITTIEVNIQYLLNR